MLAAFYRKFNLKNGLTIAASFTIAGFAVMALAKSYPALVIGCSLTGFGNQLGGIVPISLLMDRWFFTKRKLAVSICSSASGIATSFGYSSSVMATTVSIGGLSLLLGKLIYGWLCEKITQFRTVILFGSLMILGLSLLCFGGRSTAFLYAGSVLWVGSLAMIAIGLVAWPADWFSEAGQIASRQRFIFLHTGGTFAFSIVPGVLADHFVGAYLPTVYIFLAETVITLAVVLLTYRASDRTRG